MISLRDVPNDLQFSEMKTDERVAGENTVRLLEFNATIMFTLHINFVLIILFYFYISDKPCSW